MRRNFRGSGTTPTLMGDRYVTITQQPGDGACAGIATLHLGQQLLEGFGAKIGLDRTAVPLLQELSGLFPVNGEIIGRSKSVPGLHDGIQRIGLYPADISSGLIWLLN